jgi:hypothetical protein
MAQGRSEARDNILALSILDGVIEYGRWYADPDRTWRLTRDETTGALNYEVKSEYTSLSLTIHHPEKLVKEILLTSREYYKELLGEAVNSAEDFELASEHLTATGTHLLTCFFGAKAVGLTRDALEEALAIMVIIANEAAIREIESETDISLVEPPAKLIDEIVAEGAQRKKKRLSNIIAGLPQRGKSELMVARALRIMRETGSTLDLEELARLITREYKYAPPVTGEALRKAFKRKSSGWKETKKNGQK